VNTPFNASPKEQPRIAWLTSVLSFWSKNTNRITAVGVRKTRGWKEKPVYLQREQITMIRWFLNYVQCIMHSQQQQWHSQTIYFTYFHSIKEYRTILAGNSPCSTNTFTLEKKFFILRCNTYKFTDWSYGCIFLLLSFTVSSQEKFQVTPLHLSTHTCTKINSIRGIWNGNLSYFRIK